MELWAIAGILIVVVIYHFSIQLSDDTPGLHGFGNTGVLSATRSHGLLDARFSSDGRWETPLANEVEGHARKPHGRNPLNEYDAARRGVLYAVRRKYSGNHV